jgi:hypothetical protein
MLIIGKKRRARLAAVQYQEGDVAKYRSGLIESDRRRHGFVTVYDEQFYNSPGKRVFTSMDGKQGFALIDHGDGRVEIAGVYNNDPRNRGAGQEAVLAGARAGGNYIEAFEGQEGKFSLPAYYHKLIGAEPTGYLPWDDQYAPEGWDYPSYGRPGVVLMRLPEEARQDLEAHLLRPRDPVSYRQKLQRAKEEAMRAKGEAVKKEQAVPKTAKKMEKLAGYEVDDPIAAYEQWEWESNDKAEREAELAKNPGKATGK